MMWQVNLLHDNDIYEEVLGLTITADNKEGAIDCIESCGYIVVGINEILPTLKVVKKEEKV